MILRPLFEVDFACRIKAILNRRYLMASVGTLKLRDALLDRVQPLIVVLAWPWN